MTPRDIIDNMSPELKARTASRAKAQKMSLEAFVKNRMNAGFNSDDLRKIKGGRRVMVEDMVGD